jgi:hypothetical protein
MTLLAPELAGLSLARGGFEKDAPLRLAKAAELAFPDGSMTAAGLRRQGALGHLHIERINGRDYTTLEAIQEMRSKCRVPPKAPASTGESAAAEKSFGSSETAITRRAQAALSTTLQELKGRSNRTFSESGKAPAQVVRLKS